MNSQTVLLAGATGYLGNYIAKALVDENIKTKLLARSPNALKTFESKTVKVIKAEVTKPETLKGICEGVSTVISTVGITRQKDGLTYMDVDFNANLNLLNEAKRAGVKKFIKQGVDLNHVDDKGHTPIFYAITRGQKPRWDSRAKDDTQIFISNQKKNDFYQRLNETFITETD